MSNFGESWRIDGVTAAYVTRGPENGTYQVLFERCHGELPAIEAIRWDRPTVESLRSDVAGMVGLPAGCGFTVEDITYDHISQSYTVTVRVAEQYLGDVSGYQSQVAELEGQVTLAQTQAEEALAQAEAAAAAAAEKDETIAAQALEIEALRADSGAAVVASLEEAYAEGVESNG